VSFDFYEKADALVLILTITKNAKEISLKKYLKLMNWSPDS